jgi:hypothetical protein
MQHEQTRGDVEHSNGIINITSDDPETTGSYAPYSTTTSLVLYQGSARQVPLANKPYKKLKKE